MPSEFAVSVNIDSDSASDGEDDVNATMATPLQLTCVPPFLVSGESSTISQRWEKWLKQFEIYSVASGINNDVQKCAVLLHCAGEEVQEIFETMADTGDTYKGAVDALTAHFTPQKNIPYLRHVFRQEKQKDSETVSQFVTRLRRLAAPCEYGDHIEDFIRDQVIEKCYSKQLKVKLLAEKDLKLPRLLELAQAKEASEAQANQIDRRETSEEVNAVQTKKAPTAPRPRRYACNQQYPRQRSHQTQGKPQCSRCGLLGHYGSECRCTRGKTCNKCGKIGHFAVMCKSNNQGELQWVGMSDVPNIPTNQESIKYVTSGDEPLVEDDEFAYAVSPMYEKTTIFIEGMPTDMIIDSGASCNTINTAVTEKLIRHGYVQKKCNKTIYPYCSPPINIDHCMDVTINVDNGPPIEAMLLCVPGDAAPLLGRETAQKLNLLKIGVNKVSMDPQTVADRILSQLPDLCKGIGQLKNKEVKLHIDHSVPPVARKYVRTPFHLRGKVAQELRRLEEGDIIEKVTGPTEWVSGCVTPPKPKSPEEIRLCVDMRQPNKAIIRTRHVTPTMNELIAELNGSRVFSKIDLRSGYHQLVLHPDSRYITTFVTHLGLYRYKRLSFGINSAAEIFQHTIQTVLQDIENVRNISDDIIIYGPTQEVHDLALEKTLKRLHESGLTINRQKCEFNKSKIEFFGYIFSADGVSPDPKKVKALHDAAEPTSVQEIRSLLGMATYSARFIPDFATLTEPLRQLTKNGEPWVWGPSQVMAFKRLKGALSSDITMSYFDPSLETEIYVDASPVGLAGMLTQKGKIISFASRALSGVEQRYSQTEREALAIVWACEHFRMYVLGSEFKVITDHKPLVNIWDKPCPPLRISRWGLRLQPFKFQIVYQSGKENPADYMSRHPLGNAVSASNQEEYTEEYVNFIADTSIPVAMTLEEVKSATCSDPLLQMVCGLVRSGRWYEVKQISDEHTRGTLTQYRNVKNKLTVNGDGSLILFNNRIVIPTMLQKKAVRLAHEGHQGIVKTKALARSKIWFPGMDQALEEAIQACIPCQANTQRQTIEPLRMSPMPKGPWMELSMDFCGPLPSGEYLLVVVDEFSRYPVVEITRSTAAETVIPLMDKIFAMFSYPQVIKSDNGPPFQSCAWRQFLDSCGVKHRRVTPLWPRANAQAESFNKPLMKAIRAAHMEHTRWQYALHRFLRMYRMTPHISTGFTPFQLMFHRDGRTKLPQITEPSYSEIHSQATRNDMHAKQAMKQYTDQRNHAKYSTIQEGDTVLMRNARKDKLSPIFNPSPLQVIHRKGNMITARRGDVDITRNVSFFKPATARLNNDEVSETQSQVMLQRSKLLKKQATQHPQLHLCKLRQLSYQAHLSEVCVQHVRDNYRHISKTLSCSSNEFHCMCQNVN